MGLLTITLVSRPVMNSAGQLRYALEMCVGRCESTAAMLNIRPHRHDNIAELLDVDMPSFESSHRKVMKDVRRELHEYVTKARAAGQPGAVDIGGRVFLQFDDAGYPIIQGFKHGNHVPKQELEDLLRAYLRRHYCKSSVMANQFNVDYL